MKILHVFPTFVIGGAQRRLTQIVNAGEEGIRHVVLATDGCYEAKQLLTRTDSITLGEDVSRDGSLLDRIGRYRRYLSKVKPDLLVTSNWGAIEWAIAGRLAGLPHIHTEDGFSREEANRQLWRRVQFRRAVLSGRSIVVVPSKTLMSIALDNWRLAPRRVRYIPNGIEYRRGHGPDSGLARADLGLPVDTPVVGWAGALRPEKNLTRLLRAFSRLAEPTVLAIVGEGPERAEVERESRRLNVLGRVRFLGERNDVEQVLPLFDLLALSSDTEQMPMAVLEAMAAGLPVASVDVGDVRHMLSEPNRPFVTARSEEALAGALSQLISSPDDRARIGLANQARVAADFGLDQMIAAYIRLFHEVTDVDRAQSTRERSRAKGAL